MKSGVHWTPMVQFVWNFFGRQRVKLGLKNLAMLPRYFDYIFVHLKQKVRLQPVFSPKFWSTLDSNPARTQTQTKNPARLTTL